MSGSDRRLVLGEPFETFVSVKDDEEIPGLTRPSTQARSGYPLDR